MNKTLETYPYQLEQGSKKFRCPLCGKKNKYVRFVDIRTDNYLPIQYGWCERKNNCNYFKHPAWDGYGKEHFKKEDWRKPVKQIFKPKSKPTNYIPFNTVTQSKKDYEKNNFVKYVLIPLFGKETTNKLIRKYHIGTSSYKEKPCTVFWQIDCKTRVRTGKVILYDRTEHRIKSINNWAHSLLYKKFNLKQCYFGEHLLKDESKPVAIAESAKTAIIASVYLPDFIWLSSEGSNQLIQATHNKHEVLKNRKVVLYPDIGQYKEWRKEAKILSEICSVSVSDLLEQKADPEGKQRNYDLADYLTPFDIDEFRDISDPSQQKDRTLESKYESQKIADSDKNGYPAEWDEIQINSKTQAFKEATQKALLDCDNAFEKLQIKDPKVAKLVQLFDGKVEPKAILLK